MTVLELETPYSFLRDEAKTRETVSQVISVWGSAGSGKSFVAINLAFELANQGSEVLLVDMDNRRPSIAAILALTEAGPGLTAVTRLGRQSRLNLDEIKRLSAEIKFGKYSLDVLTGLNYPNRWPEMDQAGLAALLEIARSHYAFVILDLNDELEHGLVSMRSEADRNYATRWAIENSDTTLGIFNADPVGINRFLFDIREIGRDYWPVANMVDTAKLGRNPERELRQMLHQAGRLDPKAILPLDRAAADRQLLKGKPLLLHGSSSKLGNALHLLSLDLRDSGARLLNSEE